MTAAAPATRKAPPKAGKTAPAGPDCPHRELLALWAEMLPELPQHEPEQWNGARADHLRSRWREVATRDGWKSRDDGLVYFRRLFRWVRRSPFLMGQRDPARQGGRPFRLTLEWLVNPANYARVIEGQYHDEGR